MSPNDQYKDKDFVSISTQTDITVRKSFQGIQQVQCASPPVRSKVQKKNSGSKEHEDVLERRLNPRTQKDFESLFQEVEQWRDFKLRDIKSSENISSERRKEERAIILSKETKLLIKIDCLKKKVMKENLKRKLTEGLNGLSGDEVWEMSTGERIIIETPTRKYASKLADIYQQLSLYDIHDGSQRLEVLKEAKVMLETISPTTVSKDTIELINRECDFLSRGIKSLTGLRERLSNLYLQVLENETGKKLITVH